MITKKSFWKMWNKVKKCICTQKNSAAVLIYSIYVQQSAVSDSCSFLINLLLVSSTSCCFYTSSYRILWIMWRYFQEFCNTEYCKWSANKKPSLCLRSSAYWPVLLGCDLPHRELKCRYTKTETLHQMWTRKNCL